MESERQKIQRRRGELREQLQALLAQPLMRGSLVERRRRCGRANCVCARDRLALHGGKYFTVSLDGHSQALHIRPEDEEAVRAAILAYQKMWEIINGLTVCELAELRRQARERRRAQRRQGA